MLASLELFGFKSFAERTSFEFDPGVTAVVGPNGSGKSNVVDAIKWVLGDQSAKSLRGKEMTDVIFNGAAGRKPGNFAEATLTFDNAGGFLPTDEPRVRVGRRLWRNGDSEYLLDDQVARLKDVRDLFMGTGAGTSAYAIIEQGRVDQILQANAIGRRAVFEEAAGISRYKSKKNDALRRLERVEQNLLRLTDIVDEVEARLHSTRTQAAKAAEHRDASRDLEAWWLGMAADDYRHGQAALETLRETLAGHEAEQQSCSHEQSELNEQLAGLDGEIAASEEALRDAERRAAAARERIAGCEATGRYQSSRIEELTQDLPRLRRGVTMLSARANEGRSEHARGERLLAETRAETAERRARHERRVDDLERLSTEIEQMREQIANDRERQFARARDVTEAESRIAALLAERDGVRSGVESLADRLATIRREWETAAESVADRQTAVDDAEADLRECQSRADELRADRQRLAVEREDLAGKLATLREKKSATAARVAVLEDLQDRGEGFGIGVREILRRARSLGEAPWNQIHGTVADLLDVDLDEAPLLEIALGDRAQLVVIENFEAIIPYLGRASAKIAGRVGFLSRQGLPTVESEFAGVRYIEANPPHRISEPDNATPDENGNGGDARLARISRKCSLTGLPGVLKRADELIRPGSRMPHLAGRLLHDTWIVTDLETALRLAGGHGRGQRFVTQSGELLDADGTLVVGRLRTEAAVVSRRSELIRLRATLVDYERSIAEVLERQSTLNESRTSLNQTIATADAALREAADRLNQARSKRSQAASRVQRHEEEHDWLAADLEAQRRTLTEQDERLAAARAEHKHAQTELGQLRAGLEQAQRELEGSERAHAACEDSVAADRLELAKADERLAALAESLDRLERDSEGRGAQRAEAIRRLEATLAKLSQTHCQLLNTRNERATAFQERDRHGEAVRAASRSRDGLRRQRSRFTKREAAISARRRSLAESVHKTELAIREREHELATLGDRIREEYGRELPELAESEHSAIALWVGGRDGETGRRGEREASDPSDEQESLTSQSSTFNSRESDSSIAIPPYADIRAEIEARVERLRKKLRMMGAVNAESLADLDELEQRHTQLSGQLEDLLEAKRTLEELIRRINVESKRMFLETFEKIREHFQDLFRKLFGGGDGDIVLDDPKDVLESGIDIVARPPGKELRSLSLLSGGEKTIVCVALLLAIFKSKPSPFCLLDEVDAALDEANIGRFVKVLQEFKATTQFIMITHRKPSMCEADVLYGVTMEQAGVSKRLNVRFDEIADDGNFQVRSSRKAA